MSSLPFVDEHVIHTKASAEKRRAAIAKVAHAMARRAAPRAFAALWHLEPVSGFAVEEETPERVTLVGRHRFSRYELAFEIDGDTVRARTSAEFPGVAGRLYRALVIGSGGHRLAVRSMLRKIRRRAER